MQRLAIVCVILISLCISVILVSGGSDVRAFQGITPTPTASFAPDEDCLLPCLSGIVPGRSWEITRNDLTFSGLNVSASYSPDQDKTFFTIPLNSVSRENLDDRTLDRSAYVSMDILVENDDVHAVTVNYTDIGEYIREGDENLTSWEMIAPINLLSLYQNPDRVDAVVYFTGNGTAIDMRMFWFERGIAIIYELERFSTNEKFREVCITLETVNSAYLRLYSPENPDDFRNYLQNITYSDIPDIPISENIIGPENVSEVVEFIFDEQCLTLDVSEPT